MNFFDYELSRTATATPPQTAGESNNASEPSLNEEVSQVVGQLGRLWGGLRRQSQAALETARKDFASVVTQAQKEIGKLTAESGESTQTDSGTEAGPSSTSSREAGSSTTFTEKPTESTTSAGDDETTPRPSSPSTASASSSFQFQTLLSRVQASLPPNISATLERTIPAALRDPASHAYADIQHLRETLGSEFSRVQGVTRVQAEEYVHRSEALLREAGAYLKDAVRVIPPEEDGQHTGETEIVFDGMGSGVMVLPPSLGSSVSSRVKGKARETPAQVQQRLAGSRAAAMLSQLKRDPEVLKKDPLQEESAKEVYETWLREEVSSKDDGIESTYWSERTKAALDDKEDGQILATTHDALVPSTLDSATFWTRYFFRVRQIEKDEEKRKALLAASGDEGNDEDFSWEDDDDESVTPSESVAIHKDAPPTTTTAKASHDVEHASGNTLHPGGNGTTPVSYPESLITSPANTSPRESTDGYDVVSPSTSSDVKTKVAVEQKDTKANKDAKESKDMKSKAKAETEKQDDEDADSDWE